MREPDAMMDGCGQGIDWSRQMIAGSWILAENLTCVTARVVFWVIQIAHNQNVAN